jgi:hypothetical protein
MEDAFDNQRKGPKLPSAKHLKAHVLNAIGHCSITRFKPGSLTSEVSFGLRQTFEMVEFFVDRRSKEIVMKVPKQTRNLASEEMSDLIDKADAYLRQHIVPGMKEGELTANAKARAA